MIRVALIGLGAMGRNHLRVLRACQRVRVVATVDPVAGDATHRSIAGVDFDAAIVATPTATHFDVGCQLLQGKRYVLVEKPLAHNLAAANWLCELGSKRLAVGHVERFNPAIVALQRAIGDGMVGQVIHIATTRVGGYPKAITPGNDVLLDLAVHDLDLLGTMLGALRVSSAICHATVRQDVCDTAEIMLTSPSGASAAVHTNWITPCKIREMRVTGTAGVAFVDLIAQSVEVVRGSDRVAVEVERAEPLRAQLEAFLDFCEGDAPGRLCTGRDAAVAVGLAERALTASGGVVRLAA